MTPRAGLDSNPIEAALVALGNGALTEEGIAAHVAPLFSRVLARRAKAIDLANHSLGRPLDATGSDVARAIELWQVRLGDAWDDWLVEMDAYRERLARLLGAPRADCIVPKTSAGQGLRAILNSYDNVPRVVATRGEGQGWTGDWRQAAARASNSNAARTSGPGHRPGVSRARHPSLLG